MRIKHVLKKTCKLSARKWPMLQEAPSWICLITWQRQMRVGKIYKSICRKVDNVTMMSMNRQLKSQPSLTCIPSTIKEVQLWPPDCTCHSNIVYSPLDAPEYRKLGGTLSLLLCYWILCMISFLLMIAGNKICSTTIRPLLLILIFSHIKIIQPGQPLQTYTSVLCTPVG